MLVKVSFYTRDFLSTKNHNRKKYWKKKTKKVFELKTIHNNFLFSSLLELSFNLLLDKSRIFLFINSV